MKTNKANQNILNLTQHPASAEQKEVGVVDHPKLAELKALLTFEELPTPADLVDRARAIVELIPPEYTKVMIGGPSWFMSTLESEIYGLTEGAVLVGHAFTFRRSVESIDDEGNVVKTSKFMHEGFIYPQV